MIYTSLTAAYAKAIFLDGTKRFTDIRTEYIVPVTVYAASKYTLAQVSNALTQGWITQQNYNDYVNNAT